MCYHARSYETFFLSKEIHDYFLYKNSYKTVLAHEKKPKLNTTEWKILYRLYLTLGKE